MKTKTSSSTVVRMSELMTPENANFLGKVFGGAILSLLDKAAYVTASRFAETVCVTASFDRVDFHSPVEVGELVHLVGRVDFAGRTSVQTRIEVHAENIHSGTMRHTNTSIITMVAIDDAGKPTAVPRIVPENHDEKVRYLLGRSRYRMNRTRQQEHAEREARLEAMSETELDNLIASDAVEF